MPDFDNVEDMEGEEKEYTSEEDDGEEFDTESEESSENDDASGDTGLTDNQGRLLYMISLYTHPAESDVEKEEWIRKQALLVLIYEGIVAQVLDYDYAPQSELVEMRRKYFNISQEGKSDVDFLREEELINGLKLSSTEYRPVTCYQASKKGLEVLKRLPKADKESVEELVFAPGTRELLRVDWDGEEYALKSISGYNRVSTVTECEDVSYVSSAYVPQCLRKEGRPTLSNAHRAHECAMSESNIRDELDEVRVAGDRADPAQVITLNSVSIIVAEFIPFGANQIVQMNQNLGSTERVQGGFFTALMDEDASGTKFEVEPGLTSVNILDYSLTNHINFEADIHLPEAPGIIQVETFGVSMNADGTVFYGMQVEAVMDRIKDNVSLDHLARLLVDVHIDSSAIVDSVISAYQRTLLGLVFLGDAASRDKVNLIIANEITPHLTAAEYMDHGEYENELKQVLGDTRAAFDISEHDTLIFGEHGILVAGPNSRHHEPLLCSYIQFVAMDIFIRNFFNRMFLVLDDMKNSRRLIEESDKDPQSVDKIRKEMATISRDIILLEEVLGYLAEALLDTVIPPEPPEQAGRALFQHLEIDELREQLKRRVTDLKKNMDGARHELQVLREMSNIVSESKMFRMQENVMVNTRNLCQLQEANERASASLEIMQVVLAGSLAFDIMDRFTGEWTVVNTEWARGIVEPMIQNTPMLWFLFSLIFWMLLGAGLIKLMRYLSFRSQGTITLRMKYSKQIDLSRLNQFLATKDTNVEDRDYQSMTNICKVSWVETDKEGWGGMCPTVTVEYDEVNQYMLGIVLAYNKRVAKKNSAFNAEELKNRLQQDLDAAGIWASENLTKKQRMREAARSRADDTLAFTGRSQKSARGSSRPGTAGRDGEDDE